MHPPWRKLKDVESELLTQRRDGGTVSTRLIARLRQLFDACKDAEEAEEAICYHGVLSLLAEYDKDLLLAIKHREIEIVKIRRLHELEAQDPTDGYATQDYEAEDLQLRQEILRSLQAAL